MIGIDTASVAGNKPIDWHKARKAGVEFAIHRVSYGSWKDRTFANEWDRIKEAGVVRGAYAFLRFPRKGKPPVPSPAEQAKAFCHHLGAVEPGDLPIALDVEFPGKGRADTGRTASQLLQGVRKAWQVLRSQYGVPPLLYTSARVWLDDLSNLAAPDLVESPLWLARYYVKTGKAVFTKGAGILQQPPVPPPWAGEDEKRTVYRNMKYTCDNWWFHQYQGNATKCPGFSGKVDMNLFIPVSLGAKGERVRWIERRLNIPVTGEYTKVTEQAVQNFQATKPLITDGIVNVRTFAYLCWENQ